VKKTVRVDANDRRSLPHSPKRWSLVCCRVSMIYGDNRIKAKRLLIV